MKYVILHFLLLWRANTNSLSAKADNESYGAYYYFAIRLEISIYCTNPKLVFWSVKYCEKIFFIRWLYNQEMILRLWTGKRKCFVLMSWWHHHIFIQVRTTHLNTKGKRSVYNFKGISPNQQIGNVLTYSNLYLILNYSLAIKGIQIGFFFV